MTAVLDERKELFCREYLANGKNATAAYIKAGYSPNGASAGASRLLRSVKVSQRIRELDSVRFAKVRAQLGDLTLSAENSLRHIAAMAYGSIGPFLRTYEDGSVAFDFSRATAEQLLAVKETNVVDRMVGKGENARLVRRTKVKLHPKMPALLALAKKYGLLEKPQESNSDFGRLLQDWLDEINSGPVSKENGLTRP